VPTRLYHAEGAALARATLLKFLTFPKPFPQAPQPYPPDYGPEGLQCPINRNCAPASRTPLEIAT